MNMRHLNRDLENYAADATRVQLGEFLDADGGVSFMLPRDERGRLVHVLYKVGDSLCVGKQRRQIRYP